MAIHEKAPEGVCTTPRAEVKNQDHLTPAWEDFNQEQQDYMDEGFNFAHDCNR